MKPYESLLLISREVNTEVFIIGQDKGSVQPLTEKHEGPE